jgi:hypothetical protein
MLTHKAEVSNVKQIMLAYLKVLFFTLPATIISSWNCNVFNLHTVDDVIWNINRLVCIQFYGLAETESC